MTKITKKPNLFVIGAPKCGTTSMIHYLSQHSSIFVSPEKEPHYFNTDSGHRYFFDESSYLSLFQEAKNYHHYLCEGSVWYLYSKDAVKNIETFNSEARYIVMLRNPVDLYFSLHQELLYGGSENEVSAIRAWNLQEQRSTGKHIPLGCSDPKLLQYGKACKLGAQVQDLLNVVPRERVHFITLDQMKGNEDMIYNKLLRFLALEEHHLATYEIVNKKKVRKSQFLSRMLILISELKRKAGFAKGLGLANWINRRNVSHDAALPNEDVDTLKGELMNYFRSDIELLEQNTEFDLTLWKNA